MEVHRTSLHVPIFIKKKADEVTAQTGITFTSQVRQALELFFKLRAEQKNGSKIFYQDTEGNRVEIWIP